MNIPYSFIETDNSTSWKDMKSPLVKLRFFNATNPIENANLVVLRLMI